MSGLPAPLYPGDLMRGCEEVLELFARYLVRFVDTGHTHYNELVNDGRTIYADARSTGQVEEGPPGFSIAVVDGDVVSWKFKARDEPGPFVQLTTPSDCRLITAPASPTRLVRGACWMRARVWSARVVISVGCVDGGPELAMEPATEVRLTWSCGVPGLGDGLHGITARARDASGASADDAITILVSQSGEYDRPARAADGSDADCVGVWPEKGILGTQLGPNKNRRKW
ncbi:MAG: hypothetical protein ACR2KT_18960 [Methylocella sp.]|nr:MAG: metallophosphoesterase [Hyphomicrobiales bacterium]